MTDWPSLQHAYGSAGDVPALLAAAAADPGDRKAWDDLWFRLCHQGTVYSASLPALPALAAMAVAATAQGRGDAGYVEPLHLAAAIVASRDGGEESEVVARRVGDELATLRDLAERILARAVDPNEFVYGLQSLMAFEGAEPWNRELDALADGELEVRCRSCGEGDQGEVADGLLRLFGTTSCPACAAAIDLPVALAR